ncbi:hypothetical protein KXD40_006967 [Peronospora effusa]|nr:hypothetical protein KXD40_006967 [Peronospora effusa]
MMKISVLAIAAATAIVNVSAADQPVLRSEATSAEAETNTHRIITQLASTSTSTPERQDDEDLRTCHRCCDCYRQRFRCRPTCFAFGGYISGSGTWTMTTPDKNKKEHFWGGGPWVLADITRKKISYLRHEST